MFAQVPACYGAALGCFAQIMPADEQLHAGIVYLQLQHLLPDMVDQDVNVGGDGVTSHDMQKHLFELLGTGLA